MLHVLLLILKIIGIVLIALLALLLALILILLFVPVRYQLTGEKTPEILSARGKVSWFLHLVSLDAQYEKGQFQMCLKLCGKTIKQIGGKGGENSGSKTKTDAGQSGFDEGDWESEEEELLEEQVRYEEETAQEGFKPGAQGSDLLKRNQGLSESFEEQKQPKDSQPESQTPQRKQEDLQKQSDKAAEMEEEADVGEESDQEEHKEQGKREAQKEQNASGEHKEPGDSSQADDQDSKAEEKDPKEKSKRRRFAHKKPGSKIHFPDLHDLADRAVEFSISLQEKLLAFPSQIEAFFSQGEDAYRKLTRRLKVIKRRILPFVERRSLQLYKRILGHLAFLWKHYRPRKLKGWLQYGAGTPDVTGEVTGILYLLLPVSAEEFKLQPDFTGKVLNGEITAVGFLQLWVLLWVIVKLLMDQDLRWFVRMCRAKGGKKDGR